MDNECILTVSKLNKNFDATHANVDIDLKLYRGEIRGLAGENGSGKSTLASIIAGIYPATSGEMFLNGKPYKPHNPYDARKHKVGIVVQEMGLVNHLPINMNMYLGDLNKFTRFGIISPKKIAAEAKRQMKKWDLESIPINTLAMNNTVETQKLAEVIRALSVDPDILILDEVTQALSQDKRHILYNIIEKCKAMGMAVLIISHDLEEMLHLTDKITVLRDGEVVGTRESGSLSIGELRQLLVGREFNENFYRTDTEPDYQDEVVLEVKNLTTKRQKTEITAKVTDVSFELHKGEILAVCGLSDGGIHELGKAVFGLDKHCAGTITLTQKGLVLKDAVHALNNGVGYLPKDRDREALMINASVKENFVMPSLFDVSETLGFLSEKRLNKMAEEAIEAFSVKCTGVSQTIGDLSGGNKQKINLGRWTVKGADILILDCPTRGVDVGVKAYMYQLLRDLKAEGKAILMISDELQEVMGMADRIIVMKNGEVVEVIPRGPRFTEEELIEVMI